MGNVKPTRHMLRASGVKNSAECYCFLYTRARSGADMKLCVCRWINIVGYRKRVCLALRTSGEHLETWNSHCSQNAIHNVLIKCIVCTSGAFQSYFRK